jgi:hypothetical protein
MLSPLRTLPCLVALLAAAGAAAQNITATVNDVRSHGAVGDAFLSLDEAIQLGNGTLSAGSLSTQERGQLAGIGTLTVITVSAAITPQITCERALTAVTGVPGGGADLQINGSRQGNGFAVLDAGSLPQALHLKTNRAQVRGLAVRGGRVGILADTTANLSLGVFAIVADVDFAGQTDAGVRLLTPNDQQARRLLVKLRRCQFTNLPIGVDIRSESDFGRIDAEGEWLRFTGCGTGVDITNLAPGGVHQWQGFRTDIVGGDWCVRLHRLPGNDSEWLVRAAYGTYFARRTAFELDGSTAGADTVFHHHQLDVRGGFGSGDYALLTRPAGGRFDLHSSENVFEGNILIQSGRLSRRVWFVNNRFENGTLALTNDGVRPELQWNAFVATPITILSTNTQTVPFLECEFVRSPITDGTSGGTTTLTGCFLASSPTSANVAVQSPAPSNWTGRAAVTPVDPPRGGYVDLSLDLAQDTAGIWWLGLSEPRPVTTNYPFRYYLNIASAVSLPAVFVGTSRVRLPLPSQPYLAGIEFHAQPIVFPTRGQSWVPPITLPRGGRFQVQ